MKSHDTEQRLFIYATMLDGSSNIQIQCHLPVNIDQFTMSELKHKTKMNKTKRCTFGQFCLDRCQKQFRYATNVPDRNLQLP